LESSRSNEIALFDELELLESYLKLETMRMPKIRYSIETAEDLRLYDLFLPPMIVQPIVENSVKHGLANKEEGGLIQLRFSSFDDRLIIEIEDDGIGREAAGKIGSLKKRKGSSFSTEANLNRIELLNESFGLNIKQEIIDKTDEMSVSLGTKVKIVIPQENI
jgi:LytS/YehU family sensor histidine kinase